MTVANSTFGKRVKPGQATRPARRTQPAPQQRAETPTRRSPSHAPRSKLETASPAARLTVPYTWGDALLGAFLVFAGWSSYRAAEEPHALGIAISAIMIAGGGLFLLNHLTGRAKLIVDDEGMRSECWVFPRRIYWKDLHAFNIVTVNWMTTVTAKTLKMDGSQSSARMRVPNSAFKRKDLAFVETLLAHRPDMGEATVDVMKHLGAAKLLR